MLSHSQIWAALDSVAVRQGLSPSGLARRAGLDPTAFNRSKRVAADGRPRWPSTESLAKVLDATGTSLDTFISIVAGAGRRSIPLIGLAQAGEGGFFDDFGHPVGSGWDEVDFPAGASGEGIYALEITGDSMLPAYRKGDTIIVAPSVPIRRGDRVVVKTVDGEVMAKELRRRTSKLVELKSINPEHPDRTFAPSEIAWLARIIWASQ